MTPYGYYWRTYTRPMLLFRAGGRFNGLLRLDGTPAGRYLGYAKCIRCGWIDCMHGGRSELEIAHLDGNSWSYGEEYDNLAVLCVPCHRKNDYPMWAARCRETRGRNKDQKRPVLVAASEYK